MRDFTSDKAEIPNIRGFQKKALYLPFGRAQGHNQGDSLNPELTGIWTPRFTNSSLSVKDGFLPGKVRLYPETLIEKLQKKGYNILTCIGRNPGVGRNLGSNAGSIGMKDNWLKTRPERLLQMNYPEPMRIDQFLHHLERIKDPYFAHIFLRHTHRPWAQPDKLGALAGQGPAEPWPEDASYARKLALSDPDNFAALRRDGLKQADAVVGEILNAVQESPNTAILLYSNHGEVLDHFRYQKHFYNSVAVSRSKKKYDMINGTSHGPFPYEILYANFQMWLIQGLTPGYIGGISRSIDIPATILDFIGLPHDQLDGMSMKPNFMTGRPFPYRERFAELNIGKGCLSMVREDGMKFLASNAFAGHEKGVFDLTADPWEWNNLIKTQKGKEVLEWAVNRYSELN